MPGERCYIERHVTIDWDAKADWMRRRNAVQATFDASGRLLSVTLAPESSAPDADDRQNEAQATTVSAQRSATGRLVPRVVADS